MEDTISNPSMEPLLFSVDPMSLLLSHNSDNSLCRFERGPRYGEYARLRESKLRMKRDFEKILKEEEERFFGGDQPRKKPATKQTRFGFTGVEDEFRVSPEKTNKQTRFGFNYNPAANPNPDRRKSSSSLAQSVPDFSAMIRKENRRPAHSNLLPRRTELTPPPMKSRNAAVFAGSASKTRGSISASAGEKKSKVMMGMARKSYANVEDLKKISMAAASAINGGGGGRKSIGGGRTILGYRQIY